MTETEKATVLSRADIKALKTCDQVSFHHVAGKGTVRATQRGPATFYQEAIVPINAESIVFVHKSDLSLSHEDCKRAQCFDMIHASDHNDCWQTIVSLLKPGDVIELRWVGADNNGYIKSSRVVKGVMNNRNVGEKLYHDRLYLNILRTVGAGVFAHHARKYSFALADSVCPNNSARMIRIV